MNATRISAVIICAKPHFKYLSRLAQNLNGSSVLFDELIVVASGFSFMQKISARKLINNFNNSTKQLIFTAKHPAGTNRNIGWEFTNGDLTFFLDADDLYHPERNKFTVELFKSNSFDLMMHGFERVSLESEDPSWPPLSNKYVTVRTDEFARGTYQKCERNRDRELELPYVPTNLFLPENIEQFEFSHGHCIVSKSIKNKIKFHEIISLRNEDSVFARDVLDSGYSVIATNLKLSLYSQGTSAIYKKNFIAKIVSFSKKSLRRFK